MTNEVLDLHQREFVNCAGEVAKEGEQADQLLLRRVGEGEGGDESRSSQKMREKPVMQPDEAEICQARDNSKQELQKSFAACVNWPKELTPLISQHLMLQNNPVNPELQSKPMNQFLSSSSRSFLFQQQMQYNQDNKQHYFPLMDKVKAYILSLNLRQILRTKLAVDLEVRRAVESGLPPIKEESGGIGSLRDLEKDGLFFHTLDKSGQISIWKKMLKTKSPEECVSSLWTSTKAKVNYHLGVFDSEAFSSSLRWDFVSSKQIIYKIKRIDNHKLNLVQQLCQGGICANLIRIISEWLQLQQQGEEQLERSDHVVYVTFTIQGHLDSYRIFQDKHSKAQQECQYTTISIEFTKLIGLIVGIYTRQDSYYDVDEKLFKSTADRRRDSLGELLTLLGADVALMSGNYGLSVAYPEITEALIQFYRVPQIPSAQQQPRLPRIIKPQEQFNSKFQHLSYAANMSLYSISRARIQYLGASIPLFRFRHSLFEALISAIHERDIRPNFFDDYQQVDFSTLLQEPISHEKFLVKKYLEFMSHPYLKQLLVLSHSGRSLEFVQYFNSLQESMCPIYGQYKLWFYDINQREFIVENGLGKDIYIVHYNGFLFGANYPKMIIIREREVSAIRSENDSDKEEKDIKVSKDVTIQEIPEQNDSERSGPVSSLSSESEEAMLDAGLVLGDEGNDSDIDIHNGFILHNHGRNVRRKAKRQYGNLKNKEEDKQDDSQDANIGILAIRLIFEKAEDQSLVQQIPKKLICYGSLPNKAMQMMKVFEGRNCHLKFLLWILQNLIDYKIDNRIDLSMVSVFTVGGSNREMPWLLRGFVSLTGRDTHFFGDLNKLKCIWHENIKFYDLANFFENKSISQLSSSWLTQSKRDMLKAKSNDLDVQDVFFTFELARKFLKEMDSIKFNNQPAQRGGKEVIQGKKFDFHQYQTATAGHLALSVFQFLYLDQGTEIRGTWDNSIFKMEKRSLRSAYFVINKLHQAHSPTSLLSIDLKNFIYRVYQMNCLLPSIYRESPIPYLYKGFNRLCFSFLASKHKVQTYFKPFQHLSITLIPIDSRSEKPQKLTILHSSLYKVDFLRFNPSSRSSILWNQLKQQIQFRRGQEQSAPSLRPYEITDEYIWGVEIIAAFQDGHSTGNEKCLQALQISEEVTYFQSRVFSRFTNDLVEKLNNNGSNLDNCQRDILQLILDQFASKFSQRHFGMQSIIHINDLKLMNSKQQQAQFSKLVEIQYPFYYAEYMPSAKAKVGHLQHIGSLSRITSYVSACSRVKLMQSLEGLNIESDVVYIDKKNLIVRNKKINATWTTKKSDTTLASGSGPHQYLQQSNRSSYQHQDIGKWSLQYETSMQEVNEPGDVYQDLTVLSANELFLKHVDMLLSHNFHSLLAETTPLSTNRNVEKTPEEILDMLLSQDRIKNPSGAVAEFDLCEKELTEDGLEFLLPRKSDQLASLDLESLYARSSFSNSPNLASSEESCVHQDPQFLHKSVQNELSVAQTMKVLSKAIFNFETSSLKYLNGQMTAEELAQHEQKQNIQMQGDADSMFNPSFGNDKAKNSWNRKRELLTKRNWQQYLKREKNSPEMESEECLSQEDLGDALMLNVRKEDNTTAVNRPKKLPRLELQANSIEDYSLLLGGGAECGDSEDELAEEAQDADQEANQEEARSRGQLINQFYGA